MRLSQEAIQRMISGRSGGGAGGGSFDPSALAGYATQAWTEENYISKTFFNELFIVHKKVTTVVMYGETEISRTVTTNSIFAPNEIPGTTTETDEETGYVTTVTTEISSIESKKGFWTNYFISALGLNSEGGGGGLTLNEPLATINVSGLADHPSSSGQTIVWNGSAWVYGTAGGGTGTVTGVKVGDITYSPVNGIVSIPAYPTSLAWSAITSKPTTIAGYGITDAKIENGVITLGLNTITPLTSSAITDMATKTWVGQQGFALASNVYSKTDADAKFMTIAAFENLFNALNSSGQKVSHPYSSGVASIKAMVGLWTEQYLSALGKSDSGGEIVLNEPLASINDAGLAAHPSSSGQTIVWNGSAWTYGTAGGSGMTYTFATGDANGQFKVTPSSGAAYNVSIKGLAALAYKASLAVSDIPDLSGRYLPLTGGTVTGAVALNGGITPIVAGSVQTHGANGKLLVKAASASADNTPNNGIVLEYGTGSTWVGQLYMADNGEDGIYWGGWYRDERSEWKRILDSSNYTNYTYSKNQIDTELAKKLDVAFFDALFQAYAGSTKVIPNASTSSVDNIKAMFGFWTQQYISALGKNDSQGVVSALSDLVDVNIVNPTNGQVLKYNATTGKWYNGNDEGVTSLAWSQITGKPTTIAGYGINDAKIVNGTITLGSNSITPLTSSAISDMATKTWVGQQGFITSSAISDMATKTWVGNNYLPLTGGTINGSLAIRGISHQNFFISSSAETSGVKWTGVQFQHVVNDTNVAYGGIRMDEQNGSFFRYNSSYTTYKMWDAGNDGTGSGLDADLLDGQHGSYYGKASDVTTLQGYFTNGSAKTALKLNTAVSLWGQSFDGSADVSGNMTGVGSITMSGSLNMSRGQYVSFKIGNDYTRALGIYQNTDVLSLGYYTTTEKSFPTYVYGTEVRLFNGSNAGLVLNTSGNVGIGNTNPSYNLDVNGTVNCTSIRIGGILLTAQNNGIRVNSAGLYADTYVSALGLSDSGGSTFDESAMWIALGTNISQKQISSTYLTNALAPYALKTDIPTLKTLSWSYGGVTAASGGSYNGSAVTSFVIPKNTSHLVNDSGFITSSALGSYLPLSGGTLTGNLNIKYSHDLSKTNNGVSDTLWPGYRIYDKDSRRSAQFVNGVYSSGSNFVWMGVSNYDTSGNMIADYGIGLSVDKNGAGTWSVSEPAAFRTAIGIPALLGGYLPLSGGTMTGILKVATGNGIEDATGNGLLVYHPTNWSGVSASQWGAGAVDCQGVIRSNASDLKHYRGSALYNILDSYNSGVIDGKVTLNSTSLNVPISYNLPTPGTFTSGYWHRLGNYVTAGDGNNIVITIYDGTGYNGYAEQNSIARIVIKDGWQSTRAAANSVGVSIERFAYFFDLQVSVVATEHNAGALWVYLPWQYAQGTYTVEGIYTSWEHHNGTDGDTATAPVTNQTFNTSSQHSYLYFDYAYLTSNVASATKLQTTRYIWGNAFDGTADISGNLIMPNNRGIVIKDTNGVEQNVFVYNHNNDVVIGWGPRATSDTYVTGNTIAIARNGGANGFYLNTSNNIGLGGAGDSSHKLYVQGSTLLKHSGGESLTLDTATTYNCIVYQINAASKWSVGTDSNGTFYWYTQPGGNKTVMSLTSAGILNVGNSVKCTDLWIGNIHITYDSTNGGIHVANGGLSANTYVSALGVGQEGGGSQGLDIEAMWTELATPNSARQIDSSHISNALSNYVTTNTLSSYATQQWVNQQGFVKTSGVTSVAMSVPSSLRVNTGSGATITTSGTFAITLASGYSIPTTEKQSNWDTAYGWGNHATAGYSTPQGVANQMQSYAYISGNVIHIGDSSITPLTNHQSVDGTFWGQSWSNHDTVNGDMSSVGNISFSASGKNIGGLLYFDTSTPQLKVNTSSTGSYTHDYSTIYPKLYVSGELGVSGGLWAGFNELYYSTPYIDFHYDYSQADYTTRLIESEAGILSILSPNVAGLMVGGYNGDYVQIGQIRIVYESSNNALRIENANNGGAANLYAMGGISALGMSGNADGTISGNLIPSTNATYSIGSSSYGWKELRLSQYGVSGRITIDGDGINLVSNEGGYLSGALYMVTGRMIVGASDDDYDGFTFATEGTSYLSSKVSIGGTNSNSDKLYVNGTVRASSYNNSSDARLKNIISNENINIETIARAPIVRFTWKNTDDSRVHWGTLAQYWRSTEIGDIVEDGEYLAMDYAATALAGVISVARKVMTHEERIAALEAENERLRNEIETLKAA